MGLRAAISPSPPGASRWATLSLVFLVLGAPVVAQSQSATYALRQSTVNDGGMRSTSASYAMSDSLGQESAIGTSSAPHYIVQSGFWSFVGSGLVPILLMAKKNALDPDVDVDLYWTGNNPPYAIYAHPDYTNIFAHYLISVVPNAYTDTPAPAMLTCYSVLGTAPGPIVDPHGQGKTRATKSSNRPTAVHPATPGELSHD